MAAKLEFVISSRDAATKELNAVQHSLARFGRQADGLTKKLGYNNQAVMNMMKGFIGAQAAIAAARAAWRGFTQLLSESVTEYGKQVQAEAQLQTALGYTSKALLDQAAALQTMTTFADDATIQAQAMVAMFFKEEETILRLMPRIQDFAAAKRMDLVAAADLVTKTIASETNALRRYGLEVTGARGSTERAESAIRALEKAFDGQARALAATDFGKLEVQKNKLSDIKEILGKEVLPFQVEWNRLTLMLAEQTLPRVARALRGIMGPEILNPQKEALLHTEAAIKSLEEKISALKEQKLMESLTESQLKDERFLSRGIFNPKDLLVAERQLEMMRENAARLRGELGVGGSGTGGAGTGDLTIDEKAQEDRIKAAEKANVEWIKTKEEQAKQMRGWEDDQRKAQEEREKEQREKEYHAAQIANESHLRLEETQTKQKTDLYERETKELALRHNREMSEYQRANADVTAIKQIHEIERTNLAREHAEKRIQIAEMEKERIWQANADLVGSSLNTARAIVEISRVEGQKRKRILTALAIAEGAAMAVTAAKAGMDEGGKINFYYGLALAAAGVIEAAAITGAQVAAINAQSFGGGGVTPGGPAMLHPNEVVANPRQQAELLFAIANGRSGRSGGSRSDISGGVHITISGNADKNTVREIERRIPEAISRAARSGALKYAMSDMARYHV